MPATPPKDAVILAAGYGSRVQALSTSKPLLEIAGVSLLELSVRQAAAVGIERVVVVTGHCAELVEARLPWLAEAAGVEIEACRLDDWSRPNGYSVMAGADRVAGNYLLLMGDHIFERAILARLLECGAPAGGAVLAVDRNVAASTIDPADATWVHTRDDSTIAAIGKNIVPHNAVDCGAFLAAPALAEAIAASIVGGAAGSLSDGMQWLADRRQANTIDVTGGWWIDVDDPHMHALAEVGAPIHLAEIFAALPDRAAA